MHTLLSVSECRIPVEGGLHGDSIALAGVLKPPGLCTGKTTRSLHLRTVHTQTRLETTARLHQCRAAPMQDFTVVGLHQCRAALPPKQDCSSAECYRHMCPIFGLPLVYIVPGLCHTPCLAFPYVPGNMYNGRTVPYHTPTALNHARTTIQKACRNLGGVQQPDAVEVV